MTNDSLFRTVLRAVAVSAAILSALSTSACHSSDGEASAHAATAPAARVVAAQRGSIRHVLTLAGQFQPYQVVDVHPKVSGYMKHISVDIGDIVKEGQPLATLEVPELKAQLQQSEFEVDQSREDIGRAQHEISRAEAQHKALHAQYQRLQQAAQGHPGLIAQQELDDAQAKDISSEAQVDAARSAMAGAQQHMGASKADNQRIAALHNYTNVVAPISGVVVWRYADTGALVQGGTTSNTQDLPIVRLAQSTTLRLRLPVPESDVRYVHLGDEVDLRVDAIGRSFRGKIVRFTRDVNFETRTMETEVDLDNRDLAIAPGMYANAMLPLAESNNIVTVPVEAVVLSGTRQVVYTVDDTNHVHIRPVQVGIEGTKLAEIKSGLNAGERVIVGGQEKYHDGDEVSPVLGESQSSETEQETGGTIDLRADDEPAGQPGPSQAGPAQPASGQAGSAQADAQSGRVAAGRKSATQPLATPKGGGAR